MQGELLTANPATKIRILGVNPTGFEAGNGTITAGRTIPWLQDTAGVNVWGTWAPVARDVFILDPANLHVQTYNLTIHDLANPLNYAELKALLKSVAGEP